MRRLISALLFFAAIVGPAAQAADANGDFAVRGAGRYSCAELLDALEKKDNRLAIFATWLDGYITASNQHETDTFDSTPWQTTELLLALAGRACAGKPEADFMNVAGRLIADMRPLRLQEKDSLLRMVYEDSAQVHYRTVIERARQRMQELGYTFVSTGPFGKAAQAELGQHLLDFQEKSGLPPTGQLDQQTLLNLFVRPK